VGSPPLSAKWRRKILEIAYVDSRCFPFFYGYLGYDGDVNVGNAEEIQMQAGVDLTLDYRTYRLAALLSEHFPMGELLGVSLKWQDDASAVDKLQTEVARSWREQIEQRYLVPRHK